MSKTPEATIVRIPKFRAVSSGYQDYDGAVNKFMGWLWRNGPDTIPMANIIFDNGDFMLYDGRNGDNNLNWVRAVQDSVTNNDVAPYGLSEFEGGLYAVAPSIDNDVESIIAVVGKTHAWVNTSGFIYDEDRGHQNMKQMIYFSDDGEYSDLLKGLGYVQTMIYVPVKLK